MMFYSDNKGSNRTAAMQNGNSVSLYFAGPLPEEVSVGFAPAANSHFPPNLSIYCGATNARSGPQNEPALAGK